jgi:hypothetical protein
MTPTERRARHPPAVVEAWDWIEIYCRHWATTGRDWQTTDNLGAADKDRANRYLDTLREAGLVETDGGFRGNFIKRAL